LYPEGTADPFLYEDDRHEPGADKA